MALKEILFPVLLGCLAVTLLPAVFFHVQPRVAFLFPVKGRWLSKLLWAFSFLLFLSVLLLMSMSR